MSVGTKINFTSQYMRGNGTWQVMKIREDGQVWLAKLGKKGQLLTPNADNQMNVGLNIISEALVLGTGKIV